MFRVLIGTGALRLLATLVFFVSLSSSQSANAQAPTFNWSGLSLGGGVGGTIALNDVTLNGSRNGEIGLCNPFNCGPTFFPLVGLIQSENFDFNDLGDASFMGTAQVAYDFQVGQNIVVGAFADIDFASGNETSFSSTTAADLTFLGGLFNAPVSTITASGTVEQDFSFSVGGRIGLIATPQTLIYGLGAYTQIELEDAQFRFTVTDPLGGGAPTDLTVNMPDSLQGFTIGGGVETKITNSLSMKFEYRYANLEGKSETAADTTLQCCLAIVARRVQDDIEATLDMETHTIRAAFSWKPDLTN